MHRIILLMAFAGILVVTGCSNRITVGTDYNPATDFSNYQTYRWHDGNEFNLSSRQYLASDLADQRIRNSVNSQLASKGYQLRETGAVDFLINYTVTTVDQVDVDTYNTYGGYAPGWSYGGYAAVGPYRYAGIGVGYPYYGPSSTETRVTQYTKGTLVLDIVEPVQNQLVWRGIGESKIDDGANQSERTQLIDDAVGRILNAFPPEEN